MDFCVKQFYNSADSAQFTNGSQGELWKTEDVVCMSLNTMIFYITSWIDRNAN